MIRFKWFHAHHNELERIARSLEAIEVAMSPPPRASEARHWDHDDEEFADDTDENGGYEGSLATHPTYEIFQFQRQDSGDLN